MFENPGQKVKSFATILFAITIVTGFIAGIVLAIEESFWLFFLVFGGSLVIAYLVSLFLYGFGELIESSQNTAIVSKMILDKLDHPATVAPAAAPARPAAPVERSDVSCPAPPVRQASELPAGKWQCPCGRINEKYVSSCACGRKKRDVLVPRPAENDN